MGRKKKCLSGGEGLEAYFRKVPLVMVRTQVPESDFLSQKPATHLLAELPRATAFMALGLSRRLLCVRPGSMDRGK